MKLSSNAIVPGEHNSLIWPIEINLEAVQHAARTDFKAAILAPEIDDTPLCRLGYANYIIPVKVPADVHDTSFI